MEQILLPKETVIAIMMLYKNTKSVVHSPEEDTNFLDIFVYTLPRLCTLNVNRSNKRK